MINTEKSKIKNWKYIIFIPAFALGLFLVACEDKTMTEVVRLAQKSTTVTDYPKAVQDAVAALQKANPERKFLVIEPDGRDIVTQAENLISSSPREEKSVVQSITVLKDIKDDYGRLRSFLIVVYDEHARRIIKNSAKDGIYSVVEVAPSFPGGTEAAMLFVQKNISRDAVTLARRTNLQGGSVVVKFIVAADGSLSDFETIKGLSPELDQEALRVARLMPNWIPGRQNGTAVKVRYIIPIQFGPSPEKGGITGYKLVGIPVGRPLSVTYNVKQDGTKRIISGKVVDSRGNPLPGAILVVVGSTSGVSTNAEGTFILQTTETAGKLAVSYVGYETKIISF